jgi:hypothetical protein
MAAKTTATVKSLKPCECSLWEFNLDVDHDDDYNTGCKEMTHRTFAQGHDAKLVGFMVRAELAGHDVSKRAGGMLVTFGGAVHAAESISEALAAKAEGQLDAARARMNKTAKAPKVEAEDEPVGATATRQKIKVGRWTYDATIDLATGEATYTSKLGGTKVAVDGTYSIV